MKSLNALDPEIKRKLALGVALTEMAICFGKLIAAGVDGKRFFIEGVMTRNNHQCYDPFLSSRYGVMMMCFIGFEFWAAVQLYRSTKKANVEENVSECRFMAKFWRIVTMIFFGVEYFYGLVLACAAGAHNHFTKNDTLPFVLTMLFLAMKDVILLILASPYYKHLDDLVNPKKEEKAVVEVKKSKSKKTAALVMNQTIITSEPMSEGEAKDSKSKVEEMT